MPYRHLSLQERYVIHHLKLFNLSHREIGRRLGRHHATITSKQGKRAVSLSNRLAAVPGSGARGPRRRVSPIPPIPVSRRRYGLAYR